ncbi:MAG: UDP-glucose 4-epimerase GalE [Salinivirgaceae bacterium]|nr:MAG: UDP-glucose 4-epimerase GalE [Salinivirgaceae bacterium]
MNGKKILVTGGTGYIGSHTVVELQQAGYEVVIVDNLSNSEADVVDRITEITGNSPKFYKIDLTDSDALREVFVKEKDIFSAIHFAAFKAVGESVEKPLMYYRNNLNSLINLLDLSGEFKVKNVVFSSSCTVYGQPEKLPVTEQTPVIRPESPYGNTKRISEEVIQEFTIAHSGFNGIALRYFNPIGAHPSALIGELPRGVPNNLVPFVTQTAAGLRDQLKIFGDDYNTPDGTCIRDYINVVDLAKAHVAAISRQVNGKMRNSFEVFNLGTGQGASVLDIVKGFEKATGKKLNYTMAERRLGDVEQIYANASYAEKELNWKAEKTLEETLKSAWEWEKKLRNIE